MLAKPNKRTYQQANNTRCKGKVILSWPSIDISAINICWDKVMFSYQKPLCSTIIFRVCPCLFEDMSLSALPLAIEGNHLNSISTNESNMLTYSARTNRYMTRIDSTHHTEPKEPVTTIQIKMSHINIKIVSHTATYPTKNDFYLNIAITTLLQFYKLMASSSNSNPHSIENLVKQMNTALTMPEDLFPKMFINSENIRTKQPQD